MYEVEKACPTCSGNHSTLVSDAKCSLCGHCWALRLGRDLRIGDSLSLRERGLGACCVDLLLDVLVRWGWSESLVVVGDLVAVAVRDDRARGSQPRRLLLRLGGLAAELVGPWFAVGECPVQECGGALLDQVSPLREGLAHLVVHGTVGVRDESDDKSWWCAGAARSGGPCGRASNAGVKHAGNVIGILKTPDTDQVRQKLVKIVMVRLGTAELR